MMHNRPPVRRKERAEGEARLCLQEIRPRAIRPSEIPGGQEENLPLFRFPTLEGLGIVDHAYSTRFGGCSEGVYASMNLSFTRGDDPDCVRENFRRMAAALGIREDRFVFGYQTHSANVRLVTEEDAGKGVTREREYRDVDALVTDRPSLALSVFWADCVPLFFVDPCRPAIGVAHSGWKGTEARIGRIVVEKMRQAFGTDPAKLLCAIGPSICGDCYEISSDLAERFAAAFPGQGASILRPAPGQGKFLLDLWQANRIVLQEAGVRPERILVTDLCTKCNPAWFFSHRAQGEARGGNAAFLMICP